VIFVAILLPRPVTGDRIADNLIKQPEKGIIASKKILRLCNVGAALSHSIRSGSCAESGGIVADDIRKKFEPA